ncbi:hypothetical protein CEXT_690501 [Caerostris extrusa]|uniref:Uncharacterized protein n=1 Tax=Caerostris extrusa TaxID=172846 RepID=A0AAV4MMC8_CAEEX|nr:hypothetical protein CEXT_690501 [Caerostris extrusa]
MPQGEGGGWAREESKRNTAPASVGSSDPPPTERTAEALPRIRSPEGRPLTSDPALMEKSAPPPPSERGVFRERSTMGS